MTSRRNFLKATGAAAIGGVLLAGTASAQTSQDYTVNTYRPRVDNGRVKDVGFDIKVPNTGNDKGWGIERVRVTVAYNVPDGNEREKFLWTAFDVSPTLRRYQTRFTQKKGHDRDVFSFMSARGLQNIRVRYIVDLVDNEDPSRTEQVKEAYVLRKGADF